MSKRKADEYRGFLKDPGDVPDQEDIDQSASAQQYDDNVDWRIGELEERKERRANYWLNKMYPL